MKEWKKLTTECHFPHVHYLDLSNELKILGAKCTVGLQLFWNLVPLYHNLMNFYKRLNKIYLMKKPHAQNDFK